MAEKLDIIDPEDNYQALLEATRETIREEVTILQLMVGRGGNNRKIGVKVRYMPASAASNFEFDDGEPIRQDDRPKFRYKKTIGELLKKINDLCLRNIKIVDDLSFPNHEYKKGEIRFSHIAPGEWTRLRNLCFPGASFDTPDSELADDADSGEDRQGVSGPDSS